MPQYKEVSEKKIQQKYKEAEKDTHSSNNHRQLLSSTLPPIAVRLSVAWFAKKKRFNDIAPPLQPSLKEKISSRRKKGEDEDVTRFRPAFQHINESLLSEGQEFCQHGFNKLLPQLDLSLLNELSEQIQCLDENISQHLHKMKPNEQATFKQLARLLQTRMDYLPESSVNQWVSADVKISKDGRLRSRKNAQSLVRRLEATLKAMIQAAKSLSDIVTHADSNAMRKQLKDNLVREIALESHTITPEDAGKQIQDELKDTEFNAFPIEAQKALYEKSGTTYSAAKTEQKVKEDILNMSTEDAQNWRYLLDARVALAYQNRLALLVSSHNVINDEIKKTRDKLSGMKFEKGEGLKGLTSAKRTTRFNEEPNIYLTQTVELLEKAAKPIQKAIEQIRQRPAKIVSYTIEVENKENKENKGLTPLSSFIENKMQDLEKTKDKAIILADKVKGAGYSTVRVVNEKLKTKDVNNQIADSVIRSILWQFQQPAALLHQAVQPLLTCSKEMKEMTISLPTTECLTLLDGKKEGAVNVEGIILDKLDQESKEMQDQAKLKVLGELVTKNVEQVKAAVIALLPDRPIGALDKQKTLENYLLEEKEILLNAVLNNPYTDSDLHSVIMEKCTSFFEGQNPIATNISKSLLEIIDLLEQTNELVEKRQFVEVVSPAEQAVLKAVAIKTQLAELSAKKTGRDLNDTSKGSRLAKHWAMELTEQLDPTMPLPDIAAVSKMMHEFALDSSTVSSGDPRGVLLATRVTAELKKAREGTLLPPMTPEEYVKREKDFLEFMVSWGQKRLTRGVVEHTFDAIMGVATGGTINLLSPLFRIPLAILTIPFKIRKVKELIMPGSDKPYKAFNTMIGKRLAQLGFHIVTSPLPSFVKTAAGGALVTGAYLYNHQVSKQEATLNSTFERLLNGAQSQKIKMDSVSHLVTRSLFGVGSAGLEELSRYIQVEILKPIPTNELKKLLEEIEAFYSQTDIEGTLEPISIEGDDEFKAKTKVVLSDLEKTEKGRLLLKTLNDSDKPIKIRFPNKNDFLRQEGDQAFYSNSTDIDFRVIYFDPWNTLTAKNLEDVKDKPWLKRDPSIVLYHEMLHIYYDDHPVKVVLDNGRKVPLDTIGNKSVLFEHFIAGVDYMRNGFKLPFSDQSFREKNVEVSGGEYINENDYRKEFHSEKGKLPVLRKSYGDDAFDGSVIARFAPQDKSEDYLREMKELRNWIVQNILKGPRDESALAQKITDEEQNVKNHVEFATQKLSYLEYIKDWIEKGGDSSNLDQIFITFIGRPDFEEQPTFSKRGHQYIALTQRYEELEKQRQELAQMFFDGDTNMMWVFIYDLDDEIAAINNELNDYNVIEGAYLSALINLTRKFKRESAAPLKPTEIYVAILAEILTKISYPAARKYMTERVAADMSSLVNLSPGYLKMFTEWMVDEHAIEGFLVNDPDYGNRITSLAQILLFPGISAAQRRVLEERYPDHYLESMKADFESYLHAPRHEQFDFISLDVLPDYDVFCLADQDDLIEYTVNLATHLAGLSQEEKLLYLENEGLGYEIKRENAYRTLGNGVPYAISKIYKAKCQIAVLMYAEISSEGKRLGPLALTEFWARQAFAKVKDYLQIDPRWLPDEVLDREMSQLTGTARDISLVRLVLQRCKPYTPSLDQTLFINGNVPAMFVRIVERLEEHNSWWDAMMSLFQDEEGAPSRMEIGMPQESLDQLMEAYTGMATVDEITTTKILMFHAQKIEQAAGTDFFSTNKQIMTRYGYIDWEIVFSHINDENSVFDLEEIKSLNPEASDYINSLYLDSVKLCSLSEYMGGVPQFFNKRFEQFKADVGHPELKLTDKISTNYRLHPEAGIGGMPIPEIGSIKKEFTFLDLLLNIDGKYDLESLTDLEGEIDSPISLIKLKELRDIDISVEYNAYLDSMKSDSRQYLFEYITEIIPSIVPVPEGWVMDGDGTFTTVAEYPNLLIRKRSTGSDDGSTLTVGPEFQIINMSNLTYRTFNSWDEFEQEYTTDAGEQPVVDEGKAGTGEISLRKWFEMSNSPYVDRGYKYINEIPQTSGLAGLPSHINHGIARRVPIVMDLTYRKYIDRIALSESEYKALLAIEIIKGPVGFVASLALMPLSPAAAFCMGLLISVVPPLVQAEIADTQEERDAYHLEALMSLCFELGFEFAPRGIEAVYRGGKAGLGEVKRLLESLGNSGQFQKSIILSSKTPAIHGAPHPVTGKPMEFNDATETFFQMGKNKYYGKVEGGEFKLARKTSRGELTWKQGNVLESTIWKLQNAGGKPKVHYPLIRDPDGIAKMQQVELIDGRHINAIESAGMKSLGALDIDTHGLVIGSAYRIGDQVVTLNQQTASYRVVLSTGEKLPVIDFIVSPGVDRSARPLQILTTVNVNPDITVMSGTGFFLKQPAEGRMSNYCGYYALSHYEGSQIDLNVYRQNAYQSYRDIEVPEADIPSMVETRGAPLEGMAVNTYGFIESSDPTQGINNGRFMADTNRNGGHWLTYGRDADGNWWEYDSLSSSGKKQIGDEQQLRTTLTNDQVTNVYYKDHPMQESSTGGQTVVKFVRLPNGEIGLSVRIDGSDQGFIARITSDITGPSRSRVMSPEKTVNSVDVSPRNTRILNEDGVDHLGLTSGKPYHIGGQSTTLYPQTKGTLVRLSTGEELPVIYFTVSPGAERSARPLQMSTTVNTNPDITVSSPSGQRVVEYVRLPNGEIGLSVRIDGCDQGFIARITDEPSIPGPSRSRVMSPEEIRLREINGSLEPEYERVFQHAWAIPKKYRAVYKKLRTSLDTAYDNLANNMDPGSTGFGLPQNTIENVQNIAQRINTDFSSPELDELLKLSQHLTTIGFKTDGYAGGGADMVRIGLELRNIIIECKSANPDHMSILQSSAFIGLHSLNLSKNGCNIAAQLAEATGSAAAEVATHLGGVFSGGFLVSTTTKGLTTIKKLLHIENSGLPIELQEILQRRHMKTLFRGAILATAAGVSLQQYQEHKENCDPDEEHCMHSEWSLPKTIVVGAAGLAVSPRLISLTRKILSSESKSFWKELGQPSMAKKVQAAKITDYMLGSEVNFDRMVPAISTATTDLTGINLSDVLHPVNTFGEGLGFESTPLKLQRFRKMIESGKGAEIKEELLAYVTSKLAS